MNNANRITFFRVTYNNNHGRFGLPLPEPVDTGILPNIRILLGGNNRKRRSSDDEISDSSDRLICREINGNNLDTIISRPNQQK